MFEVKNVSIVLNNNRPLINNLSFSLNKGDKLAIIGEEGNGKTTLLEALLGISKHATLSGSVSYYNHSIGYLRQNIEKNNRIREKKGLSPQKINEIARTNVKAIENTGRQKTMTDEERKAAMEASTNYYKNSEKEGSLASKAAMVAKYNERTKK